MKYSISFGQNAVDQNADAYQGWAGLLNGCVPDARDIAIMAATMGYTASGVFSGWNVAGKTLPWAMSGQCTLDAWKKVHTALQSKAQPGDAVIISNSGHGGQYPTTLPGFGEMMCFYDGLLFDYEQHELMRAWPAGVSVLYILDTCLHGSTRIPLLDGTEPTIEELSGASATFWLYSAKESGEIVPGLAHSARRVKRAETVVVILDNDERIECTADHLFMLRDGTYKEAGKLQPFDSLMPLYRRIGEECEGYLKGYELVRHMSKRGRWKPTHTVVALAEGIRQASISGFVVHHENFNKRDNRPSNLKLVSWAEHKRMHGEIGRRNLARLWMNKEFREWRQSAAYRELQSIALKEHWSDPARCAAHLAGNRARFNRTGLPEGFRAYNFSESNRQNTAKRNQPGGDIYAATHTLEHQAVQRTFLNSPEQRAKRLVGYRKWKDAQTVGNNHKVVAVERTGRLEYVYDLTVEHYHNFATSAGVFVHNCYSGGMDRDRLPAAIRSAPDFINPVKPRTAVAMKSSDIAARVVQFCASQADETSLDGPQNGAFTGSLLAVWDQSRAMGHTLTLQQWFNDTANLMANCFPSSIRS